MRLLSSLQAEFMQLSPVAILFLGEQCKCGSFKDVSILSCLTGRKSSIEGVEVLAAILQKRGRWGKGGSQASSHLFAE